MQLAAIDKDAGIAVGSILRQRPTEIQTRMNNSRDRPAPKSPGAGQAVIPICARPDAHVVTLFERLDSLVGKTLPIYDDDFCSCAVWRASLISQYT